MEIAPPALMDRLDLIADAWSDLAGAGADLRPETGRWETLQAAVRRSAPRLLAALQQRGGLAALRGERRPDAAHWWWQLDELDRDRKRKSAIRTITILVVAGLLIAGGMFLFRTLCPPIPRWPHPFRTSTAGQRLVERAQDFSGAAAEFALATEAAPAEVDSWLWLGAAQQRLGQAEQADESFARARALVDDELRYRLSRVPIFISSGLLDDAESDLRAAESLDASSPELYYIWATVYEVRGDYAGAVRTLRAASAFAEARGEDELNAMSRYRLAMMMEQMQVRPPSTPAP